jgi:tetratricopeptide (TPR) repeat protein
VALRATSLGTVYYYARDFARAEAEMRRALATTPEFAVAHFGLGRIASARGQHDVAIAEVNRALAQRRNSSWLVELARIYAAAGRGPDKDRILAELETRDAAGDRFSLDNLAYIAAAEGRTDEAFAILDRAVDEKLAAMVWIAVDPRVDALRNDARFSRLLARMNLRK